MTDASGEGGGCLGWRLLLLESELAAQVLKGQRLAAPATAGGKAAEFQTCVTTQRSSLVAPPHSKLLAGVGAVGGAYLGCMAREPVAPQ